MRRQAPQNKAITAAPENQSMQAAPENKAVPPVGLLMNGQHGRVICRCGMVIAACGHIGHEATERTIESCPFCEGR